MRTIDDIAAEELLEQLKTACGKLRERIEEQGPSPRLTDALNELERITARLDRGGLKGAVQ